MARKFVLKARRPGEDVEFTRELNAEQLAVVTAPGGPMLVVAGAGTGKTRALTYRLAWLVAHGVDPGRILLVTFTNRAAREMLARVAVLLRHEVRSLWAGTFHHVANRVLRRHGQLLGIQPDFTILDREDARDLIGSCVAEAGVPVTVRRFPRKRVLLAISSFIQNTLEPLEEVLARRSRPFQDEAEAIGRVLELYALRKAEKQLLDYDDLLSAWLRLLEEHAPVREELAERFLHVLVDEYQDTNAIQGRIVDLLASRHRNVCVVGDDSQSIYSFRGANFRNIITFADRYPDAREFRLETNYRSTPEILSLANASISLNRVRLPKELRAVRGGGLRPAVVTCSDSAVQWRFVAEYVLHLVDEGRKLTDLAVLYRSHWHALELQLELQRRKIPFRVYGGLRFFEQAHIKDVLAHLRIVHNRHDEIAWQRALTLLQRVGTRLSRRLWEHVAAATDPLAAACRPEAADLLPARARSGYQRFTGLLSSLASGGTPAEMIDRVLEGPYDDYLVSHYENASLRREDLRGLANFAAQYNTAEAFLSDVALAGEFVGETCVDGPEEMEWVTLSTIHQAKGLEWPVVIIPWLADGRFPTDLALGSREEEEEERRVFHVAVTRAKDEVCLVVPQFSRLRQQGRASHVLMKPSRFLTELPEGVTEPMELEESTPLLTAGEPLALPPASSHPSPLIEPLGPAGKPE